MINLTHQYWSEFRSDGLLFENLIEELLNAIYPGQKFYKTKKTHDGNRDFEYFVPLLEDVQSKIWMECKYRTAGTLPIHDVSMTLLMAYIEGVSQILIFSYSKVTNTFFDYIAEYKARSGKDVRVYSDCELEELIFKYKDKIQFKKYFPEYKSEFRSNNEPALFCRYTLKKNETPHSIISDCDEIIISLNEEFISKLYIVNNGCEKKLIRLQIVNDKDLDYFEIALPLKECVEVPSHSSILVPFVFRLRKYKKNLQFPKIKVYEDTDQYKIYAVANKLKYRWLADTSIIGSSYKKIINDSQAYISSRNYLSVITLSGTSGIGKSRIIKELIFQAQKFGNRICYVDSDKCELSSKLLLEKLISSISELPLFDFEGKNTFFYLSHADNVKAYAAHLLYDDVDISKEKDRIAKFIVELLRKNSCVIALDNVQKYDELSLEILDKVMEYSINESMDSKIIICFNSDYIYSGTDVDKLHRQLIYYASHNQNNFYYSELCGFSKEEAYDYIEQCLNFDEANVDKDNITYTHTIDNIIDHFGKNPFYLKNILLYLEQENILRRSQTTNFYIADINRFLECMDILPPNLEALIEKREELFFNTFFQNTIINDYRRTMQFMVLLRHMPTLIYNRIINNSELLENLLNLGFIEIGSDKKIYFIHCIYERYFVSKYSPEDLSKEDLEHFISITKTLFYQEDYFYQIFLANFYLGTLEKELIEKALDKIINWNVNMELSTVYLPIISRILENSEFSKNITQYLKVYWTLSNIMVRREGIRSSWNYISIVYTRFIMHPTLFYEGHEILINLLKEGILHLINIHRVDEAHEKASTLLKTYEKSFKNTIYYSQTDLMKIYNILIICKYHLDLLEEALTINDKVLSICNENYEEQITAFRARGDIYYHNSQAWKYIKEISFWWHKAYNRYIQIFTNNLKTDLNSHLKIATYSKAVLADLMLEKYEDAKEKMSFLSRCLDNTDMLYYEINLRFIKVIYLLLTEELSSKNPEAIYTEIIHLLDQSTDMCVSYGNAYSYVNCFYLRAICQRMYGKFNLAYDNYMKTFQLLSNILSNKIEYYAWRFFFIEMSMFIKKSKKYFPINMLSAIQDDELYFEILAIYDMNNKNFEIYEENYQSNSPIHDALGKNSFPKI